MCIATAGLYLFVMKVTVPFFAKFNNDIDERLNQMVNSQISSICNYNYLGIKFDRLVKINFGLLLKINC